MARKLSHKKAFRAKPGFSRQDVKTRVMQVLKHQKKEPIGIHALEVKVQLKHDERREFYDLLEQMQKSGELWRRRNSVVLSKKKWTDSGADRYPERKVRICPPIC